MDVPTQLQFGLQRCRCEQPEHTANLIAVTGGPGAGKTAVLELASRAFCSHVAVLPEAASMLFGGGFPRHDSLPARRAAQRAIFHVQREVEQLIVEERRIAVALCDRGTLDGLAYWPGDEADFWQAAGTDPETERLRYRTVIHLRTPDIARGYNHRNPLRVESAEEARQIDERIAEIWQAHPRYMIVDSTENFVEKALEAMHRVRAELPLCCMPHDPAISG